MIRLLRYMARLNDTPQSRGTFGEMIVASIFDPRFFGEEEHYIVSNITLQTPNGRIHQIDHVAIYKTGIFCIETKNIAGTIIGQPDAKMWNVYNGGEPYDIYNPILQNNTHVNVLSEFIGWKYKVNSIIIFIKGNKPKGCPRNEIVDLQDLKDYVKNFPCDKEMTSEETKEIYNMLTATKEEPDVTSTEYIGNFNKIK